MNAQELTTWTRLRRLDFDADAAFPFSSRLARENDWSPDFTAKVIEEYRKFCFLAAHAGHPVAPSDEVDQVWHLHLTYSRHYWDTLCRDTLGRPLHHGPTQGGAAEARKFHSWYEATLASYRRYFGEPPHDVWPAARERFDERNDFVRINRRHVVTLDRATLVRGSLASLAGAGMLAGAHALAQTDGTSGGFPVLGLLIALGVLLIFVFIIAAVRRRRRKRSSSAANSQQAVPGRRTPDGGGAVAAAAVAGALATGKSPSDSQAGGADGAGADAGGAGAGGAPSGCGGGGAAGCGGAV